MTNSFFRKLTMALCLTAIAACSGSNMGPKQTVGGALGAVGGAILGSNVGKGKGNIAAIAAGTLLGAYAGSEVGMSLDRADAMYANQAAQNAFETYPSGQTSTWQNPDSGNYGNVTPTNTYRASSGEYCREYQQTITVQGQSQQAYGTACRTQDGSWRIIN